MKRNTMYSFPLFDRFRFAVDKALASSVGLTTDEPLVYTVACDAIRSSLGRPAENGGGNDSPIVTDIAGELGEVAKETTFAHLLKDAPLEPYFSAAHALRDALLQTTMAPGICATDTRWIDAIHVALAFIPEWTAMRGHLHRPDPRHVTLAHAIQFFTDRRISLVVTGDRVEIHSGQSASAAAGSLSSPMTSLGDTLAMRLLDGFLETRYDPLVGRLHLHPTPDMMGRKLDRGLPCGLVYRFALKTLGRRRETVARKSTAEPIAQLATHFAALHDVEPFSVHESTFPPKSGRVLEVLRRVATFDELFTIPQCRPEVVQRLLDELFGRVPAHDATAALQWSIEDAKEFWRLLLELSVHPSSSTFIDRGQLRALLTHRVGRVSCEGLLRSFVIDKPNTRYQFPSDAHRSETRECVIANASGDRYWLPGHVLMGPPFYERLFASRVKHSGAMSGDIGRAFEAHLVERMTMLGITCRRGDLRGQKKGEKAGDADLVIETDEVVGLFELKKKGLRRETNAGNDLQLAVDLAQGLVHGVNQLAKQEISLLRNGKLEFEDGADLLLNDRRIIKGVISLADYGGLHDSLMVRNALRGFRGAVVTAVRPISEEQQQALEKANSLFKVLGQRYATFNSVRNNTCGRDLFDNVLFHNIFFIEHLLATARTAESFLKALAMGSRVTTGSRDPFFEHAQFNSWLPP